MARTPADTIDIEPATADYPNGRQRDGASNGTVFSEVFTGDIIQCFVKAMSEAGITYDGTPDNVTNGYQLHDALFGAPWKEVGNDGGATTYQASYSGSTGPLNGNLLRYRKTSGGKYVHLEGWVAAASPAGAIVFTLPVDYRPSGATRQTIVADDGSVFTATVTELGVVTVPLFVGISGSAGFNIMMSVD